MLIVFVAFSYQVAAFVWGQRSAGGEAFLSEKTTRCAQTFFPAEKPHHPQPLAEFSA
ncbi:MAG: hypothetical protein ACI92B_000305 [Marinobacter maritimus]|jgi:hypothetical protein